MNQLADLQETFTQLTDAFEQFKTIVKQTDPRLYEQWKSGGLAVSNDFLSMYPNAHEVYEQLESELYESEESEEFDEENEEIEEENRRDEKNGLYADRQDFCN